MQQLQQQEREREQLWELNWPSLAAKVEWRAGLRPGIPVGGWVAAVQAALARAWAVTRAAGTSQGHDGNGAAQRDQTRPQTQRR